MGGLRVLNCPGGLVEDAMVTIRLLTGTGAGATPLAAYDGALAAAGAERYNLVVLSSVIPASAELIEAESIAELGDVGDRLHVVQAVARCGPGEAGAAGLGWARTSTGEGIFYEASAAGQGAVSAVEAELTAGIEDGLSRRSWTPDDRGQLLARVDPVEQPACAVAIAAYGRPDRPW